MEVIRGTSSADELLADTTDTLVGAGGDDTLDSSTGGGGNRLFGQEGDDLLLAGSNDLLVGGPGNDRLFAGTGRGVLVGGEGEDQFWIIDGELPSRVNVVRDFTRGTDILGLRGLTPEELISLRVSQLNATDTLVQVAGENVAILRNTVARELTQDDFFVAPPEPEIGFSIEPEVVAEGDRARILFELSAPAPAGGLEVNWMELDPDGAGDGQLVLEESTNIAGVRGLVEDGQPVGVVVTVAERAMQAELVLEFDQDGEPEGSETSIFNLLRGDGYIVDRGNDSFSLTITDGSMPITSLSETQGLLNLNEDLNPSFDNLNFDRSMVFRPAEPMMI